MKKLKSAVALFLTLGLTLTSFIGCHGKDSGDWDVIIDETQTQLYVSNLNFGIGYDWLNKVKRRFETVYAEESFETGKKGIQVIIDTENQVNGAWLIIPNSSWDVYFNENLPFNDYVSQGQLLDISDVVKAPAYGETKTIERKLTDDQKASVTAYDGKYYVLPHYEAYRGLSYNVKVFEDNKLFFAENKDNGNGGFVVSAKDKRSLGPNGKTGVIDGVDYSYDDGLPATVDEFFATNGGAVGIPVEITVLTDNDYIKLLTSEVIINDKPISFDKDERVYGKYCYGTGHERIIDDFYRCVQNGEKFAIDGTEGGKVLKLIFGVYESNGKKVKL